MCRVGKEKGIKDAIPFFDEIGEKDIKFSDIIIKAQDCQNFCKKGNITL